MYRLFIDEVGNHNLKSASNPSEQYLGLMGVIMDLDYATGTFTSRLDATKLDIFGTTSVVLHRREIVNRKPAPFDHLVIPETRRRFDQQLLQLVEEAEFTALCVVIDKKEHRERYGVWQHHPYHYCLTTMLERYALWLRNENATGDVLVEARGKDDNMKLERAYQYIYSFGTANVSGVLMKKVFSSKEIKLKPKTANIAALQLADLLANPAWRDLICRSKKEEMTATFGLRLVEILYRAKYRRRADGKVEGWGTKLLP